jgi:hypothetical protein
MVSKKALAVGVGVSAVTVLAAPAIATAATGALGFQAAGNLPLQCIVFKI